jgi:hypothetical protein
MRNRYELTTVCGKALIIYSDDEETAKNQAQTKGFIIKTIKLNGQWDDIKNLIVNNTDKVVLVDLQQGGK